MAVTSEPPRGAAHDVAGADVGALAEAEGEDARRMGPRRRGEPVAVRAVVGDDRGAAGLQPLEDLALGVGDLVLAGEELAVGGGDGGDDGDVRPHQPGQRGELAGMVHAHLEHAEARRARHPRQADSGTPVWLL